MSLRPSELKALADEFSRELTQGVIQAVHAPTASRVYVETRVPGRSALLMLCSEQNVARASVVEKRPANPPVPPAWQSVLRRELIGSKFVAIEALAESRALVFRLTKQERTLFLVLEVHGAPTIALLNDKNAVVALSKPARAPLRIHATWSLPEAASWLDQPSRLQSDFVHFRLAHGAELLFAEVEKSTHERSQQNAFESRLKKLEKTKAKVRADAARLDAATDFQRDGALLAQNLHRIERGQKFVMLTEYLPSGETAERTITLDPKRSPKEEVEWRFHQHKRLVRGAQMALKRLAELEAEEARVREEMRSSEAEPFAPTTLPNATPRKATQQALPPYREYVGHGDRRIWVGRGSKHNDALTFRVAKPFHHWLHALGVPGAHVVVPLQKNEVISSELLIDAAHLALHHSDAKGEPSGEVTSVPVKFVRKGSAPGAVTYTREKTLNVRVQSDRLERLLKTLTP